MMNKLFLFAVLVSLLFAVPLAFAYASEAAPRASEPSPRSEGAAPAVSSPAPPSSPSPSVVAASRDTGSIVAPTTMDAGPAISKPAAASKPAPAATTADAEPLSSQNPRNTPDLNPKAKPATMDGAKTNTTPPINISPYYSVLVMPSSSSLIVGQSQQFSAVLMSGGIAASNDVPFSWSVLGGTGTIDSNGLFVATAPGSGAVVAKRAIGSIIVTGSASVSTSAPINPSYSLAISPSSATLAINGTQQFSVYLLDPSGQTSLVSNSLLSWAASGNIGAITSNGLFKAASPGSGSVDATYLGSVPAGLLNTSVSAPVTVVQPLPNSANATFQVLPPYASLSVGATQQFSAELTINGTPSTVNANWFELGSAGAIDSAGLYTALAPGQSTVIARYNDPITGASYLATAIVDVSNVTPPNISYIMVSPDPASLFVGQSQMFIATAYDPAGAQIGVLPKNSLSWSVTPNIGAIGFDGIFNATAPGSGTVAAAYAAGNLTGTASVTVSQIAIPVSSGSGSGASSGNGGASFKTSTTLSFSCMGKPGTVKITVYDPAVKNAIVEIIYMGGSRGEKVFVKEITGTSTVSFTPEKAGDYTLHVSVGTDQTSANFFVPYCGPQTANVTQNITVRLEPSRELVFSKLVNYPGGFSKRFSVYKITDGQTESFESDIVLYLNYTGNSTKYDFDILDSVPSSVITRANQITFADRPGVVSSEPKFEWHVKSVSKGGRVSYAYSFSRPLTEQMISLFDAPAIREAATGQSAKPAQDGGLLSASIGPIFGIQIPLLGVMFAFLALLALLYFFLFGKKKEEE